ncbi:MAG: AMP-binding protein [Anaerolineales bacterium]|nr:AMP-binding protein [Anaerolineales bacterium]
MGEQFDFGGPVVWRPTREHIEQAHLTAFMRQNGIADFAELMRRSTEEVAWFTDAVLKYLDIQFFEPYRQVVDLSEGLAFPRWCVGGKMNIVHNCVEKYQLSVSREQWAVIWEGEEGEVRRLTYRELYEDVNRCANALRSLGLGKGDVVGLYLPMTPEIVTALLAIAKIGGIILPLFSGYGAGAVIARMNDAGAKALFTSDGAYRRGKPVEMKATADEAAAHIPTLKHIIVTRRTGQAVSMTPGRDHWWEELVARQSAQAETERTDAEDVLMLIYTSGTTGKPKGAVHTHCGFPVKAAQDMAFGMDTHAGDVFYWMTDMGWMMGPWLVFGALLLGGTVFLYDGAPDFPAPDRLWKLVERHKINQLGVSPTLIRSLIPHGDLFAPYDLSSLKCFASSGEPWNPAPWMWLFEQVGKSRIPIINYSGGTEISGGIVSGNPLLPLKPCAFSAPCPGMAADVFDENGLPVRNAVGELVIKAPWIGMTRGFWNDRQRYLETYWSRWENVWVHGDFAAIDEDGLWYILGRSDDTIKVAGKRLGPAEVESILVKHPKVVEAAAIGVPHEVKGNELVLFVVLKADKTDGEAEKRITDEAEKQMERLRGELREMVIEEMGKALAPKVILFVRDLPKTRNAKVMRRMIRAAYLGQEPGDTSSLVNPEAVEEIRRAR